MSLTSSSPAHRLQPLLEPKRVAILGASPRENTLGNNVVANLVRFGFSGGLYPIHPTATEVAGQRAYANIASLPEVPDCVVLALSADKVLQALEEAASHGVRAAVVFASGFAELGEEGRALQTSLQALCERTGLVICGPNCLGLVNIAQRTTLYSSSVPESVWPGGLAVVSHSGSGCIAISTLARFGLSHLVSAGNAAVLDMPEYLHYLAQAPETRAVALFMETMRDPAGFAYAMQAMHRAGKPVVALKVGKSKRGAAASAAHTGALAGSAEAHAAFFEAHGVISVNDLDEMTESLALMLNLRQRPSRGGIGIISVSGGETAMLCDIAEQLSISLPDLAPETHTQLRAVMPAFGTPSNPLDATGNAVYDTRIYEACLEALASDPAIALVAAAQDCPPGLSKLGSGNYRRIAEATARVAARVDKPVAFFSMVAGGMHPHVLEPLHAANVPTLQGTRASLLAFQRALSHAERLQQLEDPAQPAPAHIDVQPHWHARLASGKALTEREAKNFLGDHGLAVTREVLARDIYEAIAAASRLKYPLVLKIESPDIAHKSEVGGVILGIENGDDLRVGFEQLLNNVRTKAPQARIDGVLIQEMIRGGVEMIAGLTQHPPFGMGVVVGSGGVLVELLQDAALALCPIHHDTAHQLVGRTRGAQLLAGFRGAPAADAPAFEQLVARLSAIGAAYGDVLEAVDLNPVAVLPLGAGARILDALVIPRVSNP